MRCHCLATVVALFKSRIFFRPMSLYKLLETSELVSQGAEAVRSLEYL